MIFNNASRQKIEVAAAILLFSLYGYLCLHFYLERSTMTDNAVQLFKMIQSGSFNIEHLRYGSFTTQWLVLLFLKAGASLNTLLIAYSVNIFLQYFFAFCITRFYLKNKLMAWSIVAYSMSTIHYGFFYMGCDVVCGGVWICMLPAIINTIENKQSNVIINYIVLMLVILLIFSTHAFLLVIASLIIAFLSIHEFSKLRLFVLLSMSCLFFIKVKFMTDGYEAGKFSSVTKDIFIPSQINKSYFTYFFKQQWNSTFALVKYFWVIMIIIFIVRFKWKFLVTILSSLLGLYIVIYSLMPSGEALAYMDSYQSSWYLAGWIMISYACTLYFSRSTYYFIGGIFIVSFLGLYHIFNERIYTQRINYYTELMHQAEEKKCNKLFMEVSEVDMEKVMLNWASPYETLMLSTQKGRSQTIYINNDKNADFEKQITSGDFLTPFGAYPNDKINKRYFNLDDAKYCSWRDISDN